MIFSLVGRIYLVAIACAALVVGSCALVLMPPGPPPAPRYSVADVVVRAAAHDLDAARRADPGRTAPLRLDTLGPRDSEVTLFDAAGRVLASNVDAPAAPLAPEVLARVDDAEREEMHEHHYHPAPNVTAERFTLTDGLHGYALVVDPHSNGGPRRPPLVLAVVVALLLISAASLLLARSIARPLRRLADAARRFGAGQLDTRVQLARRDEVGQVAAAFDEMAGRVQALLRAQRELLANVSHELRTPLTRLRVGLDIVAESDPAAVKEEIVGLGDDLAALDRLVADVLQVASLDLAALRESAASPLHTEAVDLAQLVRHTAARFSAAAPRHSLRAAAPPRLLLEADPTLLRRVVDNLLENARKYSEPGTAIDLELTAVDGSAVLRVRDQGIGIDGADLPHVFTPFFRADRSRARSTGGVGLGLTLAQRIVVAHGGSITIDSEPGHGTTVTVTLPAPDWSTPVDVPGPARA
ncbi:MAG: HAMP domain-containing histidine kinase [Myxococcales bacterium]|nr:HAMP domain-containing histidine kinase [Myxococcales bacterium]